MTKMKSIENNDNEANASQENNIKQIENDALHLIPGFNTITEYFQEAHDAIKVGIKASNNLPTGENYNYYRFFQSFNNVKDIDTKRILTTIQTIMKIAGLPCNIEHRNIKEKFDLLVETNDLLFDQTIVWMDEESSILQNPEVQLVVSQISKPIVNGSWNAKTITNVSGDSQNICLLDRTNVLKPQMMFKDKIDNSFKPWIPRIKKKPNSLKPLALYLEEGNCEHFNHPYGFELNKFETPECQLRKSVPVKYKSLDNTQLIFISTPFDLKIALENLKNYNEIAVDLEHHSYRSFLGITCLMQISTADTDYLIDTLALRSELHELNEIFTNPTILKVFHGADLDIQWLQRDLSLYVVNMFDTHQAAKQLQFPYLSLAFLLKKYCNIDPNKHFQLADWRIRPLSEELMKCAREDTHYLLYIKDMLKNQLIELANGQNNILRAVYDMSTDICKRTYVKPIWTEEGCMNMYRKSQKMFNNKQLFAFKELHRWRDLTAREEDDSINYVLPNHMLLNIAETLPREMQGILACCNPIPLFVQKNLLSLHKIILKAREQPLVKTIPEEDFRQRLTQRTHVVDSDIWIYSSHDILKGTEAKADLPCLLDKINAPASNAINHTVTVFDASEDEEAETVKKPKFVSPFQRYKCVIPIVVEMKAQEREIQRKEEEKKEEKEKCLSGVVQDANLDQVEIDASKNRVYEHFKQVAQLSGEAQRFQSVPKKKRNSEVVLGEMHDRKRKRESDIAKESASQVRSSSDFCTLTPSLNARILHMPKKMRQKNFEQVAQSSGEVQQFQSVPKKNKKKKKRNSEVVLGEMHDRKRKRECDIAKESANQERSSSNFYTLTPSWNTRILHIPKKMRQKNLMQVAHSSGEAQQFQSVPKKNKKKKRNSEVVLGEMHDRKRKRECDIAKEIASQERSSSNFYTLTPSLNARILHMPKKMRQKNFKQVAQSSGEAQKFQNVPKKNKKKKKRNSEVVLGEMHDRKRKRECDIAKESASQERSSSNFYTLTPSLNARILHMPKKMKQKNFKQVAHSSGEAQQFQNVPKKNKKKKKKKRNSEVVI